MRRPDGLQKLLYLVILALSIYILYKDIHILVSTPAGQQAVLAGNIQRFLEDAAIRTWAPGYTATIEEKGKDSIASGLSRQIIPTYSYLADGQAEAETAEEKNDSLEYSSLDKIGTPIPKSKLIGKRICDIFFGVIFG